MRVCVCVCVCVCEDLIIQTVSFVVKTEILSVEVFYMKEFKEDPLAEYYYQCESAEYEAQITEIRRKINEEFLVGLEEYCRERRLRAEMESDKKVKTVKENISLNRGICRYITGRRN